MEGEGDVRWRRRWRRVAGVGDDWYHIFSLITEVWGCVLLVL